MEDVIINKNIIIKKLNELKIYKLHGVDGLYPSILKLLQHEITLFLNKIFNIFKIK